MQICTVCAHVFEEGISRQSETRDHFGTPCTETYTVCPRCHSDDIEDAAQCKLCGSFVSELDLLGGLCPGCRFRLNKKISYARQALIGSLHEAEREYIRDEMEGVIEI